MRIVRQNGGHIEHSVKFTRKMLNVDSFVIVNVCFVQILMYTMSQKPDTPIMFHNSQKSNSIDYI